MTPLEFAYERFGRHVAPEATTAWLYKPGLLLKDSKKRKAGARSAGMGGTVIWIGESGVRVYGPDYRDRGFAAQGDSGQGKAFVRSMCLQVPEETWMAVVFGKPGADPERLTLNARGAAVTAYYDTKEGVLTFQPKVLRAAAAHWTSIRRHRFWWAIGSPMSRPAGPRASESASWCAPATGCPRRSLAPQTACTTTCLRA